MSTKVTITIESPHASLSFTRTIKLNLYGHAVKEVLDQIDHEVDWSLNRLSLEEPESPIGIALTDYFESVDDLTNAVNDLDYLEDREMTKEAWGEAVKHKLALAKEGLDSLEEKVTA